MGGLWVPRGELFWTRVWGIQTPGTKGRYLFWASLLIQSDFQHSQNSPDWETCIPKWRNCSPNAFSGPLSEDTINRSFHTRGSRERDEKSLVALSHASSVAPLMWNIFCVTNWRFRLWPFLQPWMNHFRDVNDVRNVYVDAKPHANLPEAVISPKSLINSGLQFVMQSRWKNRYPHLMWNYA